MPAAPIGHPCRQWKVCSSAPVRAEAAVGSEAAMRAAAALPIHAPPVIAARSRREVLDASDANGSDPRVIRYATADPGAVATASGPVTIGLPAERCTTGRSIGIWWGIVFASRRPGRTARQRTIVRTIAYVRSIRATVVARHYGERGLGIGGTRSMLLNSDTLPDVRRPASRTGPHGYDAPVRPRGGVPRSHHRAVARLRAARFRRSRLFPTIAEWTGNRRPAPADERLRSIGDMAIRTG